MCDNIDWSRLVPVETTRYSSEEHRIETEHMLELAMRYVVSQHWCVAIRQRFLGLSEAGIVGVFLFGVDVKQKGDKWLWVVVGDIPSLYISATNANNQYQALNCYIGELDNWIRCVRGGHDLVDCPAVECPSDMVALDHLSRKLDILDNNIIKPASNLLRTQ